MYIESVKSKARGKTYTCHLLRESFREDGKVKHRTIANLSKVPDDVIQLLKASLKGNMISKESVPTPENIKLQQGPSFGAVYALATISKRLKINKALENSPFFKEILWLIFSRIIDQGSRLSASRLFERHAVNAVIGLKESPPHKLYRSLDWLDEHQEEIEKKLFKYRNKSNNAKLFLYDVTSRYLEGSENELSDWGYNRDKKRGKMQIVIGLLTDGEGEPVAVRVFRGNTSDTTTCFDQIKIIAESFGISSVTLVGDRGMIKNPQIKALKEQEFNFITAITKSQIESMIRNDMLQCGLFEESLMEVFRDDMRYILRRNPLRMLEIRNNREQKFSSLQDHAAKSNRYLQEHSRADAQVQLRALKQYAEKLKIDKWVKLKVDDGQIMLTKDEDSLDSISKLDGCYAIKTDLTDKGIDKEAIHDRYKDLSKVENAFRTMKTECLEVRPVYVRNAERTRGHVFVTMLAYKIVREIERCTACIKNIPIGEKIDRLAQISLVGVEIGDKKLMRIPDVDQETQSLVNDLGLSIPAFIPAAGMEIL